ncbi:MAG TPA: hypothetical protein VF832_16510 [Longimicrobiales bacterium]
MQHSESIAGLERLADAFSALAADAPGVMVDRQTHAPADAIGWAPGRNFRVRLRDVPAAGQASAYYRVGPLGLELMLAASGPGPMAVPTAEGGAVDGVWGGVSVSEGEEPEKARLILQQLRRRVQ